MTDCLFCKIIRGKIPADKVYEDEHTLAFIDIKPTNIGHTLVVPKEHYENVFDIPDDALGRVHLVAKRIATAIKKGLAAPGINVISNNGAAAGQLVFHAHIHVVPRYEGDGFKHWKGARGYNPGEAQKVAGKITAAL